MQALLQLVRAICTECRENGGGITGGTKAVAWVSSGEKRDENFQRCFQPRFFERIRQPGRANIVD